MVKWMGKTCENCIHFCVCVYRDGTQINANCCAFYDQNKRPRGEWKETARRVQVDETDECRVFETHFFYSCPVCGAEYGNRKPEHPFCKWCGASMRKEGEAK